MTKLVALLAILSFVALILSVAMGAFKIPGNSGSVPGRGQPVQSR